MGKLTHTVKGPIASFRSADVAPIESLKFHFLPKQAAGTPSPENPIPIEGWTGVNGGRAGKNLLNFNKNLYLNPHTAGGITFTAHYNVDGSLSHINVKGTKTSTNVFYNLNYVAPGIPMKAGHYIVSGMISGKVEIQAFEYNPNETLILNTARGVFDFEVHNGNTKSWIRLQVTTDEYIDEDVYPMLMAYPCSDTEYETYSEEQIPITFPNGETIYGGYVDPVAGEIVAEYTKKVFNGSESEWGTIGDDWNTDNTGFCIRVSELTHIINSNNIIKANLLRRSLYYNISYGQFYVAKDSWANLRLRMTESMTLQEFKAFLSQNNLEIVYPIATPIHIPIPAQDLKAFLDHNSFWSDTNDDTEVEYAFADRLSERKLIMDTPHIESASGAVASFSTDMKAPIVDLKAYFTPVQEGTGDPSPVNERPIHGWTEADVYESGINIISGDFTTGYIDLMSGTKQHNASYIVSDYIPVAPLKSYYFKCPTVESYALDIAYYDKNKNYIGYTDADGYSSCNTPGRSRKTPANCYFVRIDTKNSQYNNDICINYPASNTSYIAPNGITSVPITFPATKNLFNAFNYVNNPGYGFVASEGCFNVDSVGSGNACIVRMGDTFQAGTYTLSAKCSGSGLDKFRLLCSSSSCGGTWNDFYNSYFIDPPDGVDHLTFTTNESFTIGIVFVVRYQHPNEPGRIYDIQLERGSLATLYEPYGTIYGGYIDLVRGKIVATHGQINLKNKSWYKYTSNQFSLDIHKKLTSTSVFCDSLPISTTNGYPTDDKSLGFYSNGMDYCRILFIKYTDSNELSDFTAWLNNLEVDPCVVYELSTPIEYDITPQILKTLKGTNNIWSDLNGNVNVKYWTH